jgi:hypothetical protein
MVFWFVLQNWQLRFTDLGLKITVLISWFVPQNQWVDGVSVRHASRSSSLLHDEASWVRVFQSDIKTGGGATLMVHVAASRRLHRDEAEDERFDTTGCVRSCYSCFTVFFVLDHRDILVFYLNV